MKKEKNDGIFEFDGNQVKFTNKNNESFVIDLEDYEKIKGYRWYLEDTKYWRAYNHGGKPRCVRLQRLIVGVKDDCVVDHIDGDKNNNRKENLRVCSQNENAKNRKMNKNNKSGFAGVGEYKNGFYAEIYVDNKVFRKYVKTKEEAIKIRKEWEEKYFSFE